MTSYATDLLRVRIVVLTVAALAWVLLITAPVAMLAHCASGEIASVEMFLAMNSPVHLAGGWTLMLLAMMLPVLVPAIGYIRRNSLARRRARMIVIFILGYFAVWIATSPILLGIQVASRLATPQPWLPATVALGAALLWQFSPWKQRCLNRCHRHPALAAFGLAADGSALSFGLQQGLWCVGSCWGWMLFPLLLPSGHLLAMALASGLVFAERMEAPALPRWQVRGLARASRLLLAQTRPFSS